MLVTAVMALHTEVYKLPKKHNGQQDNVLR